MARRSKFGRFQVENQASDPFKHTDVAYNLDQLDTMIGGPTQTATHGIGDDFNNPSTSAPIALNQWLAPQDPVTIVNFGARTLYNIVRGLDYNSVPLGAVIPWWRPDPAVPLPSCFAICDGASYTGTDKHSYQAYGITTITVPDMRNKMVLGANSAIGDGVAATLPSVDSAAGAPGIGGAGGTNVPRNLVHSHPVGTYAVAAHTHGMTEHTHSIQNHFHSMNHVHATADHTHNFPLNLTTGAVIPGDLTATPGTGAATAGNSNHRHGIGGGTAGISFPGPPNTGGPIPSGAWASSSDGRTGIGTTGGGTQGESEGMFHPGPGTPTGFASTTAITGASGNAGSAVETAPQYYGLLYIVKIRKASPLHNTAFPVGT